MKRSNRFKNFHRLHCLHRLHRLHGLGMINIAFHCVHCLHRLQSTSFAELLSFVTLDSAKNGSRTGSRDNDWDSCHVLPIRGQIWMAKINGPPCLKKIQSSWQRESRGRIKVAQRRVTSSPGQNQAGQQNETKQSKTRRDEKLKSSCSHNTAKKTQLMFQERQKQESTPQNKTQISHYRYAWDHSSYWPLMTFDRSTCNIKGQMWSCADLNDA